jgi:hypothetical protein
MNTLVADSPTVFHTERLGLRPYICGIERDAFLRTDRQTLYDQAQESAHQAHLACGDSDFIVHIPFNQTEHELTLEYLVISQFFDLTLPIHSLPIPLTAGFVTTPLCQEYAMQRDVVSVLECFSDLIARKSSMRDANDTVLRLSKHGRDFPVLLKERCCEGIEMRPWYRQVHQCLDSHHVLLIDGLFKTLAILFVEGASPVVFSLASTASGRASSARDFSPRFLVNTDSMFISTDVPAYACDRQRFLCIAERASLTFFDLMRWSGFRRTANGEEPFAIPSFKSVSFPTDKLEFALLTACAWGASVLVAASTESGVHAWCYDPDCRTIHPSIISFDLRPRRLMWVAKCSLVIIKQNGDIDVVANPFEDDRTPSLTIAADGEVVDIECRGDAILLQSKETYAIKIIRTDSFHVYDIQFNEEIGCGAFIGNTLIVATARAENARVVIWDIQHLQSPHDVKPTPKVHHIQPISMFEVGPPVFLLDTVVDIGYVDSYGRTSGPVGLPQSYYDPTGYFMLKITEKETLDVSWSAPPGAIDQGD